MVVTHGSLQRARGRCALTIGNFDGVHRGHRALIERVTAKARELELDLLRPDLRAASARILRPRGGARAPHAAARQARADRGRRRRARARRALRRGALPRCSPERFIEDVLVRGLGTRWLLVGRDFRFGARRAGDFATLRRRAHGTASTSSRCPTSLFDGERVSSSAVRAALAAGDFDARRAPARASVHASAAASRTARSSAASLGFPTANIVLRRPPPLSGHLRGGGGRPSGPRRGERRQAPDGEPGAAAAARGASASIGSATCTASTCGCVPEETARRAEVRRPRRLCAAGDRATTRGRPGNTS